MSKRFMVTRTSTWERPCEEAERGTYTRIDHRTWKSPEEFRPGGEVGWRADGTNHRVTDEGIKRDFPYEAAWFVEMADLDALLAFVEQYGECVIAKKGYEMTLEIYDDYRE